MGSTTRQPTYRVVGLRADGARVQISAHFSREVAEKVMKLISNGMGFRELRIEDQPAIQPAATSHPGPVLRAESRGHSR